MFEASARAGGRIRLATLAPGITAEAGASVIAGRNQLFGRFVDMLGLQRVPPGSQYPKGGGDEKYGGGGLGLWDGTRFRLVTSKNSVFSVCKMLVRYSLALSRLSPYVNSLLEIFDGLYDGADVGYPTVQSLLQRAPGLYNLTQTSFADTAEEQFGSWAGGKRFVEEFLSAITRVNYNQDVGEMNSLSGSVAIAGSGDGLWSVAGGNAQVVELLLSRLGSESKLLLNARVTRISSLRKQGERELPRKYTLTVSGAKVDDPCDAVIIAAPLEYATVHIDDDLVSKSAWNVGREYQQTITTFVYGRMRPSYFGLQAGSEPPGLVLTTANSQTPFSSLARLPYSAEANSPRNWSYFKIFSKTPMTNSDMGKIFEDGHRVVEQFDWLAYPQFSPPEKFPPLDLGGVGNAIFYTSPIESAASAIEMSCISGRNAAGLARRALGIAKELSDTDKDYSPSVKDEL